MELEVIGVAQDFIDRSAFDCVHQLGGRFEPWPEYRVREIGCSFG
jgi:hypothetical protein